MDPKDAAPPLSWGRSKEGYVDSHCGRFQIIPVYWSHTSPQNYDLMDRQLNKRYRMLHTQKDAKKLAQANVNLEAQAQQAQNLLQAQKRSTDFQPPADHTCIIGQVGGQLFQSLQDESVEWFAKALAEFKVSKKAVPHPGYWSCFAFCPECGAQLPRANLEKEAQALLDEREMDARIDPDPFEGVWLARRKYLEKLSQD